jgi:hypothetical protein
MRRMTQYRRTDTDPLQTLSCIRCIVRSQPELERARCLTVDIQKPRNPRITCTIFDS